jgi:hypothetical protein
MLTTNFPNEGLFIRYFKELWLQKARMWCVGNCNISHARQDTNSTVESFHSNLKQILYSSQKKLIGHWMDWPIYHLVSDVLTHYWYGVQCKIFGYIKNKKCEGISLVLCFGPVTSRPLMFCYTHMWMTLLSWHLAIIHPRCGPCMP